MTVTERIAEFLTHKRLAVVGVSRSPKHFSRAVFRELATRGYDVVPVNPHVPEIEGCRSWPRVEDIDPPVEAALIMTLPGDTPAVVEECARAGITRLWIYRKMTSAPADAIVGQCPLMFLKSSFPHGFHRWILEITGSLPRPTAP